MNKKVILIILDGWGIPLNPAVSAIEAANVPFVRSLYAKYPNPTVAFTRTSIT
jgi:2,3-bisphosphoglycerate-independent phosphoglycerate mutase